MRDEQRHSNLFTCLSSEVTPVVLLHRRFHLQNTIVDPILSHLIAANREVSCHSTFGLDGSYLARSLREETRLLYLV